MRVRTGQRLQGQFLKRIVLNLLWSNPPCRPTFPSCCCTTYSNLHLQLHSLKFTRLRKTSPKCRRTRRPAGSQQRGRGTCISLCRERGKLPATSTPLGTSSHTSCSSLPGTRCQPGFQVLSQAHREFSAGHWVFPTSQQASRGAQTGRQKQLESGACHRALQNESLANPPRAWSNTCSVSRLGWARGHGPYRLGFWPLQTQGGRWGATGPMGQGTEPRGAPGEPQGRAHSDRRLGEVGCWAETRDRDPLGKVPQLSPGLLTAAHVANSCAARSCTVPSPTALSPPQRGAPAPLRLDGSVPSLPAAQLRSQLPKAPQRVPGTGGPRNLEKPRSHLPHVWHCVSTAPANRAALRWAATQHHHVPRGSEQEGARTPAPEAGRHQSENCLELQTKPKPKGRTNAAPCRAAAHGSAQRLGRARCVLWVTRRSTHCARSPQLKTWVTESRNTKKMEELPRGRNIDVNSPGKKTTDAEETTVRGKAVWQLLPLFQFKIM